ncbi:MAG: S4 domain-containing protein [Flavobacteriaceae bacterium]|nr:S4 domain-containing protein [Flavobacteriaceae bacterium]
MSRHQGSDKGKRVSGRGKPDNQNRSFSRGNAPLGNKKYKQAKKQEKPVKNAEDGIRLNKYVANSGLCSRREADMHISVGNVTVNGEVVTEMGHKVKLSDDVRFDGRRINPEKKAYVLLNKPKGFATTTSNTKGRTVMDLVSNATSARIKPIGRLGRNSVGLILFTNDEEVEHKFTRSQKGVPRLFHIELDKNLKYEDFKTIQDGFEKDKETIKVEEISYIKNAPKNEVGVKIKNLGNSILRKIFDHLGYDIIKIDCVAIGHLTKKDLPRGHWKHLTTQEVNTLKML